MLESITLPARLLRCASIWNLLATPCAIKFNCTYQQSWSPWLRSSKEKTKKERLTDTMTQQMASIELEMSDFSPVSFSHQNKYCRELHGIYPVRQPLRRMSVLPFLPSSRCNIESPARLDATRGWRSKIAFASHRARVRAAYSGREKRAWLVFMALYLRHSVIQAIVQCR